MMTYAITCQKRYLSSEYEKLDSPFYKAINMTLSCCTLEPGGLSVISIVNPSLAEEKLNHDNTDVRMFHYFIVY